MKRLSKLLFFISALLVSGLCVPSTYAYTRSPSGEDIYNPIDFTVLSSDLTGWGTSYLSVSLRFYTYPYDGGRYDSSNCFDYVTYPTTFTDTEASMPFDDYLTVTAKAYSASDCTGGFSSQDIEADDPNKIFTVGPAPTPTPTPTSIPASGFIVNLPSADNITASLSLATIGIFNDMTPFAVMIIGIWLGLGLLVWIISRFKSVAVAEPNPHSGVDWAEHINTTGRDVTGRKHYEGDSDD